MCVCVLWCKSLYHDFICIIFFFTEYNCLQEHHVWMRVCCGKSLNSFESAAPWGLCVCEFRNLHVWTSRVYFADTHTHTFAFFPHNTHTHTHTHTPHRHSIFRVCETPIGLRTLPLRVLVKECKTSGSSLRARLNFT